MTKKILEKLEDARQLPIKNKKSAKIDLMDEISDIPENIFENESNQLGTISYRKPNL